MLAVAPPPDTIFDFLSYTVPGNDFIDACRVVAAVSTFLLVLPYLRIAFGAERPGLRREAVTIRIGIISYLFMLIPMAMTELQQVNHDFLPWRLPLIALANFFGWWYVNRRL